MIKIGFDDEETAEIYDEDGNLIEEDLKHGDGFNKPDNRKLSVFIPEKRLEQMKEGFNCVVVNDFGDEYHLTEEERIAKNKFYEAFKVFNKCKHKYGKLDEYVKAMREALKCLDFVAENNGVYPPDKFKKMFFRDKIYVTGLSFPKYKGRDKKQLSYQYLSEFILSDEDPSKIIQKKTDEIRSYEELEELEKVLFTEDEIAKILEPESEEEKERQLLFFDIDADDPGDDNVVIFLTPKQSRKLMKKQPELLLEIKDIKRSNRSRDNLSRLVCDLTSDDIEEIAKYDQIHNYVSSSDIPEFKGDLTDDNAYHRYLMELQEWEDTAIKEDYHGKLKTAEQIEELMLKQVLEENDWNLRNLYENKEKEARLKKIRRKEKEREKKLKKKLINVQKRRDRRLGDDIDTEDKRKKKKKVVKKVKNKKEKKIDDILLSSVGSKDDMKDYKKDSLDWSWDNITK